MQRDEQTSFLSSGSHSLVVKALGSDLGPMRLIPANPLMCCVILEHIALRL